MLITASAMTTSVSTAVIILIRSGVRSGSRRSDCQNPPGSPRTVVIGARVPKTPGAEDVADAAQGVQQVRLGGVDLAAQHRHVRLHDAGVPAEVVVPDMIEDLHLGQHAVGVAHEVAQQLELGRGQLDLLAVAPDLVAVLIQLQVGELQPWRRLAAVPPGPAQHRADPGDDLFQAEGLGHVVVAAEGQAADLVLGRVARGQEHHRDPGAAAAQPPDDIEAVHVGQHHIEHDEVGAVPLRGLYCLAAGRRGDHLETGVAQAGGQQLQDVGLILNDQQPGIRGAGSVRGLAVHGLYCRPAA